MMRTYLSRQLLFQTFSPQVKPRRPVAVKSLDFFIGTSALLRPLLIFLGALLLSAGDANAQSAPQLRDVQLWTDVQLTVPVIRSKDKKTDRVSLVFQGTLRFGSDVTRASDERTGVTLDFKVKPYLTLSPGYMFREDQPVKGKTEMEHRIKAEATLEKKFPNVSFRSRMRFEFRIRSSMADSVRFRNRFTASVPVKKKNSEIFSVFIHEEPFYDFARSQWVRNELSAGISKKFTRTFTLDLFYMMQLNKSSFLKEVHALGTAFKFRIP